MTALISLLTVLAIGAVCIVLAGVWMIRDTENDFDERER